MKILFDQGTPAPLRHALAGHSFSTAYEMSGPNSKTAIEGVATAACKNGREPGLGMD